MEEEIEIKMNGRVWLKQKMVLGSGGSATVYLGKSKKPPIDHHQQQQIPKSSESFQIPTYIAVKSASSDAAENLYEECKVFSELKSSPYIIQYYGDTFTYENKVETYNLCLEFAHGGSLSSRIKREGMGLPETKVRSYTQSILLGLKHIHERGFVHCDMKPHNILLCDYDVAKIGDFGLSERTHRQKSRNSYKGTPSYLAPELIFSESYEPSLDVWGIGCIVLEMLSGKPPWRFESDKDVNSMLRFIVKSVEVPLVPRKLSFWAMDFLKKCLVRDPNLRWTPDMLLKHPFVAIDFEPNLTTVGLKTDDPLEWQKLNMTKTAMSDEIEKEEWMKIRRRKLIKQRLAMMVEAKKSKDAVPCDVPRLNLPTIDLKKPVDDPLEGEKMKTVRTAMSDEIEKEELRKQQRRELIQQRLAMMAEAKKSKDAVPCGVECDLPRPNLPTVGLRKPVDDPLDGEELKTRRTVMSDEIEKEEMRKQQRRELIQKRLAMMVEAKKSTVPCDLPRPNVPTVGLKKPVDDPVEGEKLKPIRTVMSDEIEKEELWKQQSRELILKRLARMPVAKRSIVPCDLPRPNVPIVGLKKPVDDPADGETLKRTRTAMIDEIEKEELNKRQRRELILKRCSRMSEAKKSIGFVPFGV